ncbi:pre-mRNA processing RNA-helicase, partial [Coemansia sp. RSA 2673]
GLTAPEDVQALADAFLEKVRQGKERHGGKSGFGGKGLEKLDHDRDMVKKIQKITYSAATGETLDDDDDDDGNGSGDDSGGGGGAPEGETVRRISVALKPHGRQISGAVGDAAVSAQSARQMTPTTPGPLLLSPLAPGIGGSTPTTPLPPPGATATATAAAGMSAVAQAALLAAQAAARRLNIASEARGSQAAPLSIVDQINQQLGTPTTPTLLADLVSSRHRPGGGIGAAAAAAAAAGASRGVPLHSGSGSALPATGNSSANIPARWRATNHEALSQITEQTGAAITTRGIFVPPGKPVPEGERKLYLSIESDSERSAELAKSEIKRLLTEATILIMEQDARSGGGAGTGGSGRYSVV